MVELNSDPRFFTIKNSIVLTQTDTTVGFLSQDKQKLQTIKQRDSSKPFIVVYASFKALQKSDIRVPTNKKRMIRRIKKTTFIVKSRAFRVAKVPLHSQILEQFEWSFSTSANERAKNFDRAFCEQKADIIIEDKRSLVEGTSSNLYKINTKTIMRLR